MFGVGTGEIMLLLVIALLVLGPERMPKLARDLGRVIGDLRRTSNELRDDFLHADEPPQQVIRFKTPKPTSGADIVAPPLNLPPMPAPVVPQAGTPAANTPETSGPLPEVPAAVGDGGAVLATDDVGHAADEVAPADSGVPQVPDTVAAGSDVTEAPQARSDVSAETEETTSEAEDRPA